MSGGVSRSPVSTMRQQSPVGAAGRAASRAAAGLSAPVTSTVRIS